VVDVWNGRSLSQVIVSSTIGPIGATLIEPLSFRLVTMPSRIIRGAYVRRLLKTSFALSVACAPAGGAWQHSGRRLVQV
jgi:hypothetical protein